jgi:hypothetical protein
MIGKFSIWTEDQFGHISKAFVWQGLARDGIAKAKAEAQQKKQFNADVWATPIANIDKDYT